MNARIEETKKNIIDAANFTEPEKVPMYLDASGWAFHYSGVRYDEVMDDPEKCAQVYCKVYEEVPVDTAYWPGLWMPNIKLFEALGSGRFVMNDDGMTVTHNQAVDQYFGPEIYDEIIADYPAMEEKYMKHTIPAFSLPKEDAYAAIKKAAEPFLAARKINDLIYDYMTNKLGIYGISYVPTFHSPFSKIFDSFRGIKEALIDLRRRPEKVKEASDAIWEVQKKSLFIEAEGEPLPAIFSMYHPECFFSEKQYDELYFKYFMEAYEPAIKAGKKCELYGEGGFIRHLDRFRELPKGAMIIQLCTDDAFEVHDKIGDWATIMAGARLDMLQSASKQECIDYTKKCFDTFAPGGGFIFAHNQSIVSPKDAKIENFRAVYEEADKLGRK